MAIGPNDGRILHLYDAAGRCLKSFGEYFSMPPELESFKGQPMFSAPLLFNASGDGRIFVLNPHKYEISVFKNGEVEATIQGKNDNFKPVRQKSRSQRPENSGCLSGKQPDRNPGYCGNSPGRRFPGADLFCGRTGFSEGCPLHLGEGPITRLFQNIRPD